MKLYNKFFKVIILCMLFLGTFNNNSILTRSNFEANAYTNTASYEETDPTWFVVSGNTITGLSTIGKDNNPKEIVIPEMINGTTITKIGDQAFFNNSTIEKLIIPSTITYIDYKAFSQCSALTEVRFLDGDDLHVGLTFDLYIFQNSFATGAKVYLPTQILNLGNGPFRDTPNLSELHMPDKLTKNRTIRLPNSFVNNSGITYLEIPEYINALGGYFIYKSDIEYIDFKADANTVIIEDKAFQPQYGVTHPDDPFPIIFSSEAQKNAFENRSPDYIHEHLSYELELEFCDKEGNHLPGYPVVTKLFNFPYTHTKDSSGVWSNDSSIIMPTLPANSKSTGWTYSLGGYNDILPSDNVTSNKAYENISIDRKYVSIGEYQHTKIDVPSGIEGIDYITYGGSYYKIEPILWEVIEQDGDVYTLLSTNLIDSRQYDENWSSSPSWNDSDLREWMNGEFIDDAFNDYEEGLLVLHSSDYMNILSLSEYNAYANKGLPLVLLENSRNSDDTYYLHRQTEFIHFGGGMLFYSWMNYTNIEGEANLSLIVDETITKALSVSPEQYFGVRIRTTVDATDQVVLGDGSKHNPWTFMPFEKEPIPSIKIDYINETLTGFDPGATYLVNGEEYLSVDGTLNIDRSMFSTRMVFIKKGNSMSTIDSDTQTLDIPARPVIEPNGDNHDGKLTNVDTGYIYQNENQTSWNEVVGTTVTGLVGGEYNVQKQATETSFKSEIVPVTLKPVTTTIIVTSPDIVDNTLITKEGTTVEIEYNVSGANGLLPDGQLVIKVGNTIITTIDITSSTGSYFLEITKEMKGQLTVEYVSSDSQEYQLSNVSIEIDNQETVVPPIDPSDPLDPQKPTNPDTSDNTKLLKYVNIFICTLTTIVLLTIKQRKYK